LPVDGLELAVDQSDLPVEGSGLCDDRFFDAIFPVEEHSRAIDAHLRAIDVQVRAIDARV